MKCNRTDSTLACAVCLAEAGAPCPMGDLDVSHQGREPPPPPSTVSGTVESAHLGVLDDLDTERARDPGPANEPKVVHFKSRSEIMVSSDGKPVDTDVVEQLEHYLERAKKGEITGFAIAANVYDGGMSTYWTGPTAGATLTLLGAIDHLKWRINSGFENPDG